MLQTQPPQPDHMPDGYGHGSDTRTDYQIYDDNALLHQEIHAVLARLRYNDQEIERRKAWRREQFNWPAPQPRPAPVSMPLAPRRTYHLHAGEQAGRMRMIVDAEAQERRHG